MISLRRKKKVEFQIKDPMLLEVFHASQQVDEAYKRLDKSLKQETQYHPEYDYQKNTSKENP